MTLAAPNARLLSLYPNSSGLCYALFEGALRPVDWGIKTARRRKHAILMRHAHKLVALFAPTTILLPMRNPMTKGSHRLHRTATEIANVFQESSITVHWYSRTDIKERFSQFGATTKDAIASTIARLLPEFEQHLPPARRLWQSEDYRMGLFDAVAMVIAFYRNCDEKSTQSGAHRNRKGHPGR